MALQLNEFAGRQRQGSQVTRSAASLGDVIDEKKVDQKRQPTLSKTTPEKRVLP